MNPYNSLLHALRKHGGFATTTQLEAVRPKLRDLMKTSLEMVDDGFAVWDEGPDGTQELRLTDETLARMSGDARQMTVSQLREAIDRGENLVGFAILIVKG